MFLIFLRVALLCIFSIYYWIFCLHIFILSSTVLAFKGLNQCVTRSLTTYHNDIYKSYDHFLNSLENTTILLLFNYDKIKWYRNIKLKINSLVFLTSNQLFKVPTVRASLFFQIFFYSNKIHYIKKAVTILMLKSLSAWINISL